MRVWDIPPAYLCRVHLLGQHREVHAIYSVITKNLKGYSKHPETLRWVNWLDELALVHEQIVAEMLARDFKHHTPIYHPACGFRTNYGIVDPIWRQIEELRRKYCECNIDGMYQWYDLFARHLPTEVDSDITVRNSNI